MIDTIDIFFISTIPAGITIVYYLVNRSKINQMMKKENPKFTGHPNNTFDLIRIIKAIKDPNVINESEKLFLKRFLLLLGISYVIVIIWLVIFFLL